MRYFPGQHKLKLYLGLGYNYSKTGYNSRHTDIDGAFSSDGKVKTTAFVPTLGLAYFVNQSLAVAAGLSYNINHDDQHATVTDPTNPTASMSNASDSKSLSLAIDFQLFIDK